MTGAAINGAVRRVPVWLVYVAGLQPLIWLFWLGLTGGLGVEPIKTLEQRYGLIALQLLLAALCVSPLRRWTGINLVRIRRAIGVLAFVYAGAHVSVWLLLDVQSMAAAWQDVRKRPYITVGMAAALLLLPLAVTSNDWSVRRLRSGWRQLHRLTYPAVLLAAVHFAMLTKGWQTEPLVYLAMAAALIMARWSGGAPNVGWFALRRSDGR